MPVNWQLETIWQLEAEHKMKAAKYIEKLIFNINLTQVASCKLQINKQLT